MKTKSLTSENPSFARNDF